jgi:TPP-dependent pyruvate/acetoin dehydrogenase alpha subunit
MQKRKTIGMVYVGDGATSTGAFHEAANFAAVQNLPLIIVAENNGYAYSTPTTKQMRVLNLADRAKAYGMSSEIVDGNDVMAVYESARRAAGRARKGAGPTLLEAKTFRMRGHAAHDNQSYVRKEVLDQWRKRDPIALFEKALIDQETATQVEIEAVSSRVEAALDQDLAWAESQPPPAPESADGGVYAENTDQNSDVRAEAGSKVAGLKSGN